MNNTNKTKEVNQNRVKLGKTIKCKYNDLKYQIGTTHCLNCKAVYINLEMWMNPDIDVETAIKAIRRRFISNIGKISKIYIDGLKSHIIDYSYPEGKKYGNRDIWSFVAIEITLLAEDVFNWGDDLIFSLKNFGESCFDLLISMDEYFELRATKKGT